MRVIFYLLLIFDLLISDNWLFLPRASCVPVCSTKVPIIILGEVFLPVTPICIHMTIKFVMNILDLT